VGSAVGSDGASPVSSSAGAVGEGSEVASGSAMMSRRSLVTAVTAKTRAPITTITPPRMIHCDCRERFSRSLGPMT